MDSAVTAAEQRAALRDLAERCARHPHGIVNVKPDVMITLLDDIETMRNALIVLGRRGQRGTPEELAAWTLARSLAKEG